VSYQQKDGTGALFKNDKDGNEKRPDYKGTITINGEELDIAGWLRESKNGTKYMSLMAKPKQERAAPKPQAPKDDFGDSIPF
jgi:uncharacterized protein (DUF736 family)